MSHNNDLVLIGDIFDTWKDENYPGTPLGEAFELFSSDLSMKNWDLSTTDIEDGIVGGGNDGGIDAVYTLLDREIVESDHRALEREFARNYDRPKITLVLIQAKKKTGFEETAIDKVIASCRDFLNLSKSADELERVFNPDVVERIDIFRRLLRNLAAKIPEVRIEFKFATLGSTSNLFSGIINKAQTLETDFGDVVAGSVGKVDFLGAAELLELYRQRPRSIFELQIDEASKSGEGMVALTTLKDYFSFLTTEDEQPENTTTGNPELLSRIFEWNVRDYQGGVAVNKEIRESLMNSHGAPFWWKNNGVTIVSSKFNLVDKTVSMIDPQVVNGLQTSNTIFETLKGLPEDHHAFSQQIQVRILMTEDEDQRDQVIRATNRQTAVTDASLYATESIQRDIEQYLLPHGWYYDRRKNYYKNTGRPKNRIVGILALSQSLMAAGLNRPDDARARPGSLIKKDDIYRSIFDSNLPLELYLWVISTQDQIDKALLEISDDRAIRNNLKFHVLAAYTTMKANRVVDTLTSLKTIATASNVPDPDEARYISKVVKSAFDDFVTRTELRPEAVAKGREFVTRLNTIVLMQSQGVLFDKS